jgi:beta-glucosidase
LELTFLTAQILNFVRKAQESGIPFEAPEKPIDTPAVRALLREAANAGVVLLKNDDSILPLSLKFGTRIAVIGPNANTASYAGGGSASLPASYTVTPLEAITAIADEAGASVSYTIGADCTRWTPLLDQFLRAPDGTPGVECSFFQEE